MSKKGFAPLMIILIVAAVLVLGGVLYYSNQNHPSPSQSTASNLTVPVAVNEDYCSMTNGCPTDKCRSVTSCTGGEVGDGCAPGETTCEYKDTNLKAGYIEVSAAQAKQCVQNFIIQNQSVYPTLKYFEIDANSSGKESDPCSPIEIGGALNNKKDEYCWFMAMRSTDKDLFLAPQFYVGAQTCTVYWSLPDAFKTDLASLASVGYSPDQAIVCAEHYISANKTKYLEYKNFVPGSLSVPNKTPGPNAKVTSSTEDALFYTVIGNPNPYLVVGAHSCKVYGVSEQYYTKL